ncbi:hypothetical protein ATR1_096c0001, partial [Acetobacter tropicalis]
ICNWRRPGGEPEPEHTGAFVELERVFM